MYKAIIFDMDDTLIQTKKAKYVAHIHTAKKHFNLDIDETHLNLHWGKPFPAILSDIYMSDIPASKLAEIYIEESKAYPIPPYKGALDTLEALKDNYKLGLLTSSSRLLVEHSMSGSGLPLDIFSHIQTSEDSQYHKPDPRVFDLTIKRFGEQGINPSEMLYVGDALSDAQASLEAGLNFIGIASNTTSISDFENIGAKAYPELVDLIKALSS